MKPTTPLADANPAVVCLAPGVLAPAAILRTSALERPCIVRAKNDLLFDDKGRTYIDLFSAHGTTWLGHANERVTAAVVEQLHQVWNTGGLETPVGVVARALVESHFPESHGLAALYSTGMEAAEFALRLARITTQRNGVVGFARSMHGKSLATACLGWDNRHGVQVPGFHRLPFVPNCPETAILLQLEEVLATGSIAAVFVEPVQGCGGAVAASPAFYQEVEHSCRRHRALLVFDEILTGFHRTGPAFVHLDLGIEPDVILIGKALGNGFPVAGVVARRSCRVLPEMLPGSTFAGNPLAVAAARATLEHMQQLPLVRLVADIERTILSAFADLPAASGVLRGRGALWVLELPDATTAERVLARVYPRGVAVSCAGRFVRLLPAATIDPRHLTQACDILREEIVVVCQSS